MSKRILQSIYFNTAPSRSAKSGAKSIISRCRNAMAVFARNSIAKTKAEADSIFRLILTDEEQPQGKGKTSQGKSELSRGIFSSSATTARPSSPRTIFFNEEGKTSAIPAAADASWCASSSAPAVPAHAASMHNATNAQQQAAGLQLLSRIERTRAVAWLANWFSRTIEEEVTPRRALCLLHAHIAVLFLIVPADISISLRALFLVWAIAATLQCRR